MAVRIPSTVVPFLLATLLSAHGLRKRSLSPTGAAAAFVVGFAMMSPPVHAFGVSLIVFYLTGSRATKYGKQRKAQLEDGYHEAGYRGAWQVVCNSFAAFIASVVWTGMFVPGSGVAGVLERFGVVSGSRWVYGAGKEEWCPLGREVGDGWSRALLFASLGHFACCLGDTLASELGILSRSRPILITTLKAVPHGTNGGVSVGGTAASVAGGLVMGVTMGVCLVLENAGCRGEWASVVGVCVWWGAVSGGVGSLVDSLLGATVQRTRYSTERKRVLQDDSLGSGDVKVISGINVLTNNQVNLVSSALTAVVVGAMA